MLIGYARVSTDDQDTDAQTASLRKAGCERVFTEKASGGRWDRPELAKALEQLRAGDVLVVWKLDRLSRSLKDLLTIIERIDAARQKGRIGGRRSKLNQEQKEEARRMVASGEKSAADVARLFNVHPSTISRLLDKPA